MPHLPVPHVIAYAAVLAFPALVVLAAARDAASFTIPNAIPLLLLAIFPIAALSAGLPLTQTGLHLAVGAGVLVVGMVMFAVRWLGGGDAKLFAAVALWVGWSALPDFLLGAALAGGVLATVLMLLRSAALRQFVLAGPRFLVRLAEPGEGVPYGVAIAVGALAALPKTPFAAVLGPVAGL